MNFQGLNLCSLVDDELEEELVNRLKMGPSWVN